MSRRPTRRPPAALQLAPRRLPAALGAELAIQTLTRFLADPDPDEVLKRAGLTRANLRALEADDEVAQTTETRRDAYLVTPWRIEPGGTRAARHLSDELTPWAGTCLAGAWNAVPYGYSVMEALYTRRPNGRIGLDRLAEKPFEWFHHQDRQWFYRDDTGRDIPADPRKFLVTIRGGSTRNPMGEALYSRLYWPVFFRAQGWARWMRYLERFSMPVITGQVSDPGAFTDAMRGAGIDLAIGVGIDERVTAAWSTSTGEFERVERNCVQRIQRLVLGQTATSGIEDAGSYAAARVLDGVRDDKRRADLRLGESTGQRLLDILCELNGYPRHQFLLQDDAGLQRARADRDAILVRAGIVRFTADYLIDSYGLDPAHFTIPAPDSPGSVAPDGAPPPEDAAEPTPRDLTAPTPAPDPDPALELTAPAPTPDPDPAPDDPTPPS